MRSIRSAPRVTAGQSASQTHPTSQPPETPNFTLEPAPEPRIFTLDPIFHFAVAHTYLPKCGPAECPPPPGAGESRIFITGGHKRLCAQAHHDHEVPLRPLEGPLTGPGISRNLLYSWNLFCASWALFLSILIQNGINKNIVDQNFFFCGGGGGGEGRSRPPLHPPLFRSNQGGKLSPMIFFYIACQLSGHQSCPWWW